MDPLIEIFNDQVLSMLIVVGAVMAGGYWLGRLRETVGPPPKPTEREREIAELERMYRR